MAPWNLTNNILDAAYTLSGNDSRLQFVFKNFFCDLGILQCNIEAQILLCKKNITIFFNKEIDGTVLAYLHGTVPFQYRSKHSQGQMISVFVISIDLNNYRLPWARKYWFLAGLEWNLK
jgi:hypothetical protein